MCATHKQQHLKTIESLRGKRDASASQMQLMEKYDVVFHHLNLAVERTSTAISGSVRTIAVAREPIDTFAFQLYRTYTIDSIIGAQSYTFSKDSDVVYVPLERIYQPNEKIDISIYYRGTAPAAQSAAIGAGFSNRASPTYGNRITWSLSQPYSAYEWWPCKQSLQDKIDSIKVYVTTDTSNKVGSNGLLKRIVPATTGKHRYEWESNYPISYYLISIAVGQYTEYSYYAKPTQLPNDSILVQNYLYNQLAFTNNKASIEATVPQLEMFSDKFGLYPFYKEKYGHSMAPFSGGMEHQTMTTQGVFPYDIVAHELAHQWFGDQVTCATWSDIWLNEGFATYGEYIAEEFLRTDQDRRDKLAEIQNAARNTDNSVWVNDTTDVSRIFNSNSTYQKGAAIVHVLRYQFNNDSIFFAMLRAYQNRYSMKTADIQQFKTVAEEFYGADLTDYFDQWYFGKGYPVYAARWNQIGNTLVLSLSQTNGRPAATTRFTSAVPVTLKTTTGDTTIRVQPTNVNDTFSLNITRTINTLEVDPQNWILKGSGSVIKDNNLTALKEWAKLNQLHIYPNPTHHSISYELSTNHVVYIMGLDGKQLIAKKQLAGETNVDLSTLSKGVYIIEWTDLEGNKLGRNKLIKH